VIALAVALRLGVLPFRAVPTPVSDLRSAASATAGLLLLVRLPGTGITRMPDWFFGLAFAGAVITMAIAVLDDAAPSLPALGTAALYVAGTSAALGSAGIVAAATCAWLLGITLIGSPVAERPILLSRASRVARIVGGLCLVGMPLTVGFVGSSGLATYFATRGWAGTLLLIGLTLSLGGLVYLVSRHVLSPAHRPDDGQAIPLELELDTARARETVGWLAAVIAVFAFGIAPGLLDAGSFVDTFGRNGLSGWLTWIAALALGVVLWRTHGRWSEYARAVRRPTTAALSLNWLYGLLGGAAGRLGSPLARVFTLLESDGALLWAMIIALLLLLIARPGGP
jgi:hypothetical protein